MKIIMKREGDKQQFKLWHETFLVKAEEGKGERQLRYLQSEPRSESVACYSYTNP